MRDFRFSRMILCLTALGLSLFGAPKEPTNPKKNMPSTPLSPVSTPTTVSTTTTVAVPLPREMKLLLLAVDGNEPSLQALKFFLDHMGTPYDVVLTLTQPLPPLFDTSRGYYQGILLATGNLGVCDPTCRSALSAADWTRLDNYAVTYGVRTVAYYAWPEARYGLAYAGTSISTTEAAPQMAAFTASASTVFTTNNRAYPVEVSNAYVYLANPAPAVGETTTPMLTIQGKTVAAVHKKADGREYMAMTMDNNPYLNHSMALSYSVFNWVTKGVFLGNKKAYLMPQNDDLFLSSDLFVYGNSACMPSGFIGDPTADPSVTCPTAKMTGGDLNAIKSWQDNQQNRTQFRGFKTSMVFNGFGITFNSSGAPTDDLSKTAKSLANNFHWVNHTFNHENLDCYNPVPNSGVCPPANSAQSTAEIVNNINAATKLGVPLDRPSMVTPGISGLTNYAFINAAKAQGIKYFVSDTSKPEGVPMFPNTIIVANLDPSMKIIPRRATNIFYNTKSALVGAAGSETDEYNYFYGPNGLFRINGQPFFSTNQTWAQIVDRESDNILTYMLRGEMYPVMFHQANFIRYSGSNSLFTDVVGAALTKFSQVSTMPVLSPGQSQIGQALEDRTTYHLSGVRGVLTPGVKIELSNSYIGAKVPVTGICKTNCETYGSQVLSQIPVTASTTTTITLP